MSDTRSRIEELVERFERNTDTYRSQGYNEAQARREFIDPFSSQKSPDEKTRIQRRIEGPTVRLTRSCTNSTA